MQCLQSVFQLAPLARRLLQMTHATLDCAIRLGHSKQLKGGIPFEDCRPVFNGPLLSHSHALCTPSRLARILLRAWISLWVLWAEPYRLHGFPAKFLRPSINRSSFAINSGLLRSPPLWISSSLCIKSATFSIASSKAGEAGRQT